MQWFDRIVEHPKRFALIDNGDGTYTLDPRPGNIFQAGTPVNAANMNSIENRIAAHLADDVNESVIHGIPIGGTEGQVLKVASDGSLEWGDLMTSPIKSIQRGIATGTDTVDVTIAAVDLAKSVLIVNGAYAGVLSGDDVKGMHGGFINSTTIRFTTQYTGVKITANWQVIEYV
jgi:hypothetical protein